MSLSKKEFSLCIAFLQKFFGNEPTLIWDETYFFIGKSSSNKVNRSTYGGQKKRHYVKFMSIVLPDSYVIDILGPFQGTMNDANITKQIIDTNNSIAAWRDGEGQMIMDRGFRDVVEVFEQLGYETHLSPFLKKHDVQFSTEDINTRRLCTKTRWVVEAFHGRLKKWRILDDRVHNSLIPKLRVRSFQV